MAMNKQTGLLNKPVNDDFLLLCVYFFIIFIIEVDTNKTRRGVFSFASQFINNVSDNAIT